MNIILRNIVVGLVFSISSIATAQTCRGIQRFCNPSPKKSGFVYNGQSVFGSFAQGDTAEVSIVVYKNMDYRIVLCAGDEELDGQLQFKIVEELSKPYWEETKTLVTVEEFDEEANTTVKKQVEKVTKKRKYGKIESVRYDNSKYENNPEFVFSSDKTRKLTIKVYIPELGEDESNGLSEDAMSCVGLLIEHQQSEKTGFRR